MNSTPTESGTEVPERRESKIPLFADTPFGIFHRIVTALTFFGCWGYAITLWGWFIGVGLGWIPALVFTVIVWALLPLAAFLTCIVLMLCVIAYVVTRF